MPDLLRPYLARRAASLGLACVLACVAAPSALAQVHTLTPSDTLHVMVHEAPDKPKPDVHPRSPFDRCTVKPDDSVFAFDHFGSPLNAPGTALEEGGEASVYIYTDTFLASRMRVQRTSAPLDAEQFRFAGIDGPKGLFLDSLAAPDTVRCDTLQFIARELAGGRNSFQIDYLKADGSAFVTLGAFSIPAARRYAGIATFGVVASFLEDRRYTLVPEDPAADSSLNRVAITRERSRFQYVLGLSPFFHQRAIRPGTKPRIFAAPFVGFDLEKPFSNLYLGGHLSVLDYVYLTGGAHIGRVTRSPAGVELLDGQRYNGTAIPTIDPIRVSGFVGLTADARLAISALGGLLKGLAK